MKLSLKKAAAIVLGSGLLALPMILPNTAQADDLRISLNLGGHPAPVVYRPVQTVRYVPVPQPVVVRTVYAPAYPPHRMAWRGPHHGPRYAWNNNGWHDGRRVSYRW